MNGDGVFENGTSVTVTAEARPGYVFIGWTEAGIRVSTDAHYTFASAAPRSLVANFAALPALQLSAPAPGTLTVKWPAGVTGWVLQESADLSLGWGNSTRPITVVGSENQVTISPLPGRCFFRLGHP